MGGVGIWFTGAVVSVSAFRGAGFIFVGAGVGAAAPLPVGVVGRVVVLFVAAVMSSAWGRAAFEAEAAFASIGVGVVVRGLCR